MLQDSNVERYVENAIKPLKKEIAKLKLQIKELNKALRIHDVVGQSEQLVCNCQGCGEIKKVEYCEKCYADNLPNIAN